jgi:hypothetical protein
MELENETLFSLQLTCWGGCNKQNTDEYACGWKEKKLCATKFCM